MDEIDLLLHPRWQREVIYQLSSTFPKLQFVLTTHSPLVAGGLSSAQIRVMRPARDWKTMTVDVPDVNLYGKSADHVLLSPVFDLKSVRPPPEEKHFTALATKASAGDAKATRDLMRLLAGEAPA